MGGRGSRSGRRRAVASFVLAASFVVAPVSLAGASPVQDQERKVEQIADELERLERRFDELGIELAAAEQAKADLDIEIAAANARVAELKAQVGALDAALSQAAIDEFMGSGSTFGTSLFGAADQLTDDMARAHLTRVALEMGTADLDQYDDVLRRLGVERAQLQDKMKAASAYATQIADAQAESQRLHEQYETDYAQAQAELGQLLEEEEQRRAEDAYRRAEADRKAREAAARDAARASTAAPTTDGPGRGGGAGGGNQTGGNQTGGNQTGGADAGGGASATAPAPQPDTGSSGGGGDGGGAPPVSSKASIAVNAALGQLGVPYRFAASSPGEAFDCSGLTKYAWGRAGVSLPHQSAQQFATVPHVTKDGAQPGDLIFYYSPIGHVGIYLGGGQMVHAPRSGDVVKIVPVNWGKVVGVGRPG